MSGIIACTRVVYLSQTAQDSSLFPGHGSLSMHSLYRNPSLSCDDPVTGTWLHRGILHVHDYGMHLSKDISRHCGSALLPQCLWPSCSTEVHKLSASGWKRSVTLSVANWTIILIINTILLNSTNFTAN